MRILQDNPFLGIPQQSSLARTNAKEQWNAFSDTLKSAIDEVDALDKNAQNLTQDAVLGRVENLHDVMIAAQKAKTAMNLTIEVRSKVIDAYKEIMRMQF